MRTLDPILKAAVKANAGNLYVKAEFCIIYGSVDYTHEIIGGYSIEGTSIEVLVTDFAGKDDANWFRLERGLTIDGINYTITTSWYAISKIEFKNGTSDLTKIQGKLFPNEYISIAGDGTWETVLTNFCAQFNKTAIFQSGVAWKNYQFLPTGRMLTLSDANKIYPLLQQKYLVFAMDNGNEEIYFYQPKTPSVKTVNSVIKSSIQMLAKRRKFLWKDELEAIHTSGDASYLLHNLGFLPSTAVAPPVVQTSLGGATFELTMDLEITNGDYLAIQDLARGTSQRQSTYYIKETLNLSKAIPWYIEATQNVIFGSTEGGSSGESTANYTQLNTSGFDGFLTTAINNLQAFADWVNDYAASYLGAWSASKEYRPGQIVVYGGSTYVCILTHTNQAPPNATYWTALGSGSGSVTNGDSHDHSGGDGAQIAHSSLSGIGSNTHTQIDTQFSTTIPATYAPIAKGVTNGDSHNHAGGDGAQIAHSSLSGVGANTHAQIDTALSNVTNGWIELPVTAWTYGSASTFTLSGDGTSFYVKGLKIKFTQGGTVKYAVVKSSSYASSTTTVTIVVNDDYTIANSAISAQYYSYYEAPNGWPGWFNYTPTYGGSGSMTYTSVTTAYAKYQVIGKNTIHAKGRASGTTGGTANQILTASLPAESAASANNLSCLAGYVDGAGQRVGTGIITAGTPDNISVLKADRSNYSLAAGIVMTWDASYEME